MFIPRKLHFSSGICIAYGIATYMYPIAKDLRLEEKVLDFPTDHVEFFGPINPIGKTMDQIQKEIDNHKKKDEQS